MAKKLPKIDDIELENDEEGGGKTLTVLITFFIIVIWLIIFALFVKLDIGGFGSGVLSPIIKNVPVINKILPSSGIETDEGWDDDGEKETYNNLEEALAKIKELEKANEKLSESLNDDSKGNLELQAEISRLRIFEEKQLAYEKDKEKFDKEVVFGEKALDIEEYKKYYETVNPTNAENIYREVVEQLQYAYGFQEKADIYSKMDPGAAAKVLENMTSDLRSVSKILLSMKASSSAEILNEMDPAVAAKITKMMLVLDEEKKQ